MESMYPKTPLDLGAPVEEAAPKQPEFPPPPEENLEPPMDQQEDAVVLPKNRLILAGVIAVGIGVILMIIGGMIGYYNRIEHEVLQEAKDTDQQVQQARGELETLQGELEENQATMDELNAYKTNKTSLQQELKDLQQDVDDRKMELSDLDGQIRSKQEELDLLTADVNEAIGQPITLPAGDYVVGEHLPEGRYRVTGSSNFVARSPGGNLKINIILGNYGVSEYVTTLTNGMTLECRGRDTFTPVAD